MDMKKFPLEYLLLICVLFSEVSISRGESLPTACLYPPNSGGFSRDRFRRYYYNTTDGSCRLFLYGGHGGNDNNFKTAEACEKECEGYVLEGPHLRVTLMFGEDDLPSYDFCNYPPEAGEGDYYLDRYYFNGEKCELFLFHGFFGNKNRFMTERECLNECRHKLEEEHNVRNPPVFKENGSEDYTCDLPLDEGFGNNNHKFYYFNGKKCDSFFYRGTFGNMNRFTSEEECLDKCGHKVKETSINREGPLPTACLYPPNSGMCSFSEYYRYYYNKTDETCRVFVYGGCDGNDNNFKTAGACQEACGGTILEKTPLRSSLIVTEDDLVGYDICDYSPEAGEGDYDFNRYYFNGIKCERFYYHGNYGNDNRFNTENECFHKCRHKIEGASRYKRASIIKRSLPTACLYPPNSGMCMAAFRNYYYNTTDNTCRLFIYGGCGGNDNNFRTADACQEGCGGTVLELPDNQIRPFSGEEDLFGYDFCDYAPEAGEGNHNWQRYYFKENKCETFIYHGFQGNKNNFWTEEECLDKCGHKIEAEENEV